MAIKDLTKYLTPNLELPYNGKTYVVTPPDRETGLMLTAINVAGVAAFVRANTGGICPTCGHAGEMDLDEKTKSLLAVANEKDLGELSLGAAYQEMIDDRVPAQDLELFELYAFYYWVLGEKMADEIIAARATDRAARPEDIDDPKASTSPASPNSHDMESVNPSRTQRPASQSTRTTGSRAASSARSAGKTTRRR